MELIRRWGPVLVLIALTLGVQVYVARRLNRRAAWAVCWAAGAWMLIGVPWLVEGGATWVSSDLITYLMAASLFWMLIVFASGMWMALRVSANFQPSRREFLAAAPLVAAGSGVFVAEKGMKVEEVELRVRGLHKDLNGLRIVQLTDIHYGPFLGRKDLERAVAMANEFRPHVAFLTGDLITRAGDDLEGCLRVLQKLKAEAGVLGCHGNHEMYSGAEEAADDIAAQLGMRMLRGEAARLRFGAAALNVVGHDYQRLSKGYIRGAENLVERGALNLLLQHNPDVFPRAAAAGFDIMLAGHTHGGQLNLEIQQQNLNLARIFTPFVRGKYERGGKLLYVSSGLGTVGMPVRLGAPPEVTVIRLCAG